MQSTPPDLETILQFLSTVHCPRKMSWRRFLDKKNWTVDSGQRTVDSWKLESCKIFLLYLILFYTCYRSIILIVLLDKLFVTEKLLFAINVNDILVINFLCIFSFFSNTHCPIAVCRRLSNFLFILYTV